MKGKIILLVGTLAVGLVGTVPALAQAPAVEEDFGQIPFVMVDCIMGVSCIGTSGDDPINGSQGQDFIFGLKATT